MDVFLEIRPQRKMHLELHLQSESHPTVFFIHGLGGRGMQWREQIRYFRDQYNLVIPDLLGHGESDKPKPRKTNPYHFLEFAQDLALLFDKFATHKNILLGHSYGGALATWLAYEHQSKIQQLLLMAPISCKPNKLFPAVYHLPTFLLEWLRPVLEKQFQQCAFAPTDNPHLIETESLAGKKNSLYVIKAMLQGFRDIPSLDMTTLSVPTTTVLGKLDKIIPVTEVSTFYEKCPHHKIDWIDNASHMIMLEQPTRIADIFREQGV